MEDLNEFRVNDGTVTHYFETLAEVTDFCRGQEMSTDLIEQRTDLGPDDLKPAYWSALTKAVDVPRGKKRRFSLAANIETLERLGHPSRAELLQSAYTMLEGLSMEMVLGHAIEGGYVPAQMKCRILAGVVGDLQSVARGER